jgi:AmmeMemoRadiSam system protein A
MGVTTAEQNTILLLVRSSVEVALGMRTVRAPGDAPVLEERRGAFVTLKIRRRLRGCIGRVEPDAPLRAMLPDVARLAALADPRFPPVAATELEIVRFEISLLTIPAPLASPGEVVVGRHGLIIAAQGHRGLLLPQVAEESGWSAEEFLARTCEKAGLPEHAWRDPAARVLAFEAEVFGEPD